MRREQQARSAVCAREIRAQERLSIGRVTERHLRGRGRRALRSSGRAARSWAGESSAGRSRRVARPRAAATATAPWRYAAAAADISRSSSSFRSGSRKPSRHDAGPQGRGWLLPNHTHRDLSSCLRPIAARGIRAPLRHPLSSRHHPSAIRGAATDHLPSPQHAFQHVARSLTTRPQPRLRRREQHRRAPADLPTDLQELLDARDREVTAAEEVGELARDRFGRHVAARDDVRLLRRAARRVALGPPRRSFDSGGVITRGAVRPQQSTPASGVGTPRERPYLGKRAVSFHSISFHCTICNLRERKLDRVLVEHDHDAAHCAVATITMPRALAAKSVPTMVCLSDGALPVP